MVLITFWVIYQLWLIYTACVFVFTSIDEVAWEGEKIIVLNEVTISPPYRAENVSGDIEASVIHVKKIVDKHWKELQQPPTWNLSGIPT